MASVQAAASLPVAASDTKFWLSRLRERCGAYYPELPDPAVRLCRESRRPQSLLVACELTYGEHRRSVIVKVPTAASPLGEIAAGIPRVAPLPDSDLKHQMEYLALEQIHRSFSAEGDPRFGAIHVLDRWPECGALVMEHITGVSLRSLLSKATVIDRREALKILEHLKTVGGWLARFQSIPPHELCRPRGTLREEFEESIARMTEYLTPRTGLGSRMGHASGLIRSAAKRLLPESIPLGLAHGDFAPRNVLIDGSGRVTVIDTLARFQAPIYEDLGYFINDLHTARLQTCTLGAAYSAWFLHDCRSALLRGCSKDPDAIRVIPLFEAQALLDRWCARAGGGNASPPEKVLTRMHFWRRLRHLCSELTESA